MKKSLIALAGLAALSASPAFAQSSVTLFGIVDATLAFGRGSVSNKTALTNSGYNSSRLGFRGTEDLGGGMSASFWLEAGFNNDDGTGAATNLNNQTVAPFVAATGANAPVRPGTQGLTFNRRATVSLAGGWGEVRLGRDYSSLFWNIGSFDPFGYNGVGTTVLAATSIVNATMQVRVSNSIGYHAPGNLGGFYGQTQYYMGENNSGAATSKDGTGANARVGYANGPVNVALAFGKTRYSTGDISDINVGGQWDFGVAKLMGYYQRNRVASPITVTGRGGLIGGLIPVGAGEIRLAYSSYRTNATAATPQTDKWALGYVHNLSKRTALYATYAHVRNRGGNAVALNNAVTAASSNSTGYDFGVRHSF